MPLLSSGLSGGQLTGPGHASFVADAQGRHFAVYHASTGSGSFGKHRALSAHTQSSARSSGAHSQLQQDVETEGEAAGASGSGKKKNRC